MLLKSVTKTRWNITADRVTIRPYGRFYLDSIFLALVGIGVYLWLYVFSDYAKIDHGNEPVFMAIGFFVFFIASLGFANTFIEFDNHNGIMNKKLMGITISKIPFSNLHGISSVGANDIYGGSYEYRIFTKHNRYGSGIVVSRNYRKKDDANAIAFITEVVPAVDDLLLQHNKPLYNAAPASTPSDLGANALPDMLSYHYFVDYNGAYVVKGKKIGVAILGAFFILFGVSFLTLIPQNPIIATIGGLLFLLFGFFCIVAVFTKIIFNKASQTIERTGTLGYLNKHYHFEDFVRIETVRMSTNFIYTTTVVNLRFNKPGKPGKTDLLTIASLRTSKQIEQFIHEFYQITGLNNHKIKQNSQTFH